MPVVVLVLGPRTAWEVTSDELHDLQVEHVQTQEDLADSIGRAVALVDAAVTVRVDANVLDDATQLRVISCASTGTDHIDHVKCAERGIAIRTISEDKGLIRNLTPAAEMTWGLVLACARRIVSAHQDVLANRWQRSKFPGVMLRGKQLGVVGCGRIGQWVARYGNAFGMRVVAYDPYLASWPKGIERVPLQDLVQTSDVITVHVPLSDETKNLLNDDILRTAKPGSILVNTSRGEILDEHSLVAALLEGRVGAVGVDVLRGEPDVEGNPLLEYARTHENVVITPHCGGYSLEAVELVTRSAAAKVREYL